MKSKSVIWLVWMTAVVLGLNLTVLAQDDIKARMKARQPAVDGLKARGTVGENNQGFLEFRGAPEQADVVTAENGDRAAIYEAIGKQQGAPPALVGQRRALQLRDLARPGEWLQDEVGKWYRK